MQEETDNAPTVSEIRRLHIEILGAAHGSLVKAIRIGELLTEQKKGLDHGEWLAWLKSNVPFSESTARRYIRCFDKRAELKSVNVTDLADAYRLMAGGNSISYLNQPGINASKGNVPLAGTKHLYRVAKLLWPEEIESVLETLLINQSLHVCCGKSRLGNVRCDNDKKHKPDIVADASSIPVEDESFASVLCDPPYNGKMDWNHKLLAELSRIASKRIIFQHWFIPANPDGLYRKAQDKFALSAIYVWQPRTYFGRAQLISVFDHV